MRRISICGLSLFIAASGVSLSARAAEQTAVKPADDEEDNAPENDAQGTIVRLEANLAYIDLGEAKGIQPGVVLRVLRTITAKHPVTGEELTDHFPIGKMTIEQVSRVLSVGRLERRISDVVKVGDKVTLIPRPTPSAKAARAGAQAAPRPGSSVIGEAPTSKPGQTTAPAGEAEAVALSRAFERTLGLAPGKRANILSEYVLAHPNSPYAAALTGDIALYRRWEASLRHAPDPDGPDSEHARAEEQAAAEKKRRLEGLTIIAALPNQMTAGDPIELAITMRNPAAVQAAFAYVRRPTDNSYERISLKPDGDGYFRGRLPSVIVAPPSFELFMEAIGPDGEQVTSGNPLNPFEITVDPPAVPPSTGPRGRSEIHGFFEYVDFNRFKGNDYYLVTEGDFTYRPGGWLAGVSSGFGVLYGRGGRNDDLQQLTESTLCGGGGTTRLPAACGQLAGFNYGYFETEFRFGKWVSMAPRLMIGQTVTGPGAGGELKLRIGQVNGTNLQLAASYFQNFGALGSLHLEWNVVPGWPMGAAIIVTNQPAQGDVGVRIVYQIAYRARPWLQPALRLGVAARNIEQIGLNLGFGLLAAW